MRRKRMVDMVMSRYGPNSFIPNIINQVRTVLETFSTNIGRSRCQRKQVLRAIRSEKVFWVGCVCPQQMENTTKRERGRRTLILCHGFREMAVMFLKILLVFLIDVNAS